jgi:parvulin-like peptidyl-prolyl isomerase
MPKHSRPEKELTRKQLALSRDQQRKRRWILTALAGVAAVIVLVAAFGVYDQLVLTPARPVAIVNGVGIRLDQYQGRDYYNRFVLDQALQNLNAQMAQLGSDSSTQNFLVQFYQQMYSQYQQQREAVDANTLSSMVEQELDRQKGMELGLSVTDQEINEDIRSRIAAQIGAVTVAEATSAASTATAATATAALFTPTPEPTATATLTATATATLVPTSEATPVVTPTVPTTPEVASSSPLPTPTPPHIITDEEYSRQYASFMQMLAGQHVTEADYRSAIIGSLWNRKVTQYFADNTPREAEQAHLSNIQVDTPEKAQAVMDRLNKGEDFALVATEVSSDTYTAKQGGDMGWVVKGDLTGRYGPAGPAMETAAFSLPVGSYSQPITTTTGLEILKVNERETRPLTESQLSTQEQKSYSDWLTQARSAPGVQILWTSSMAPPDPSRPQQPVQPSGGIPSGGSNLPPGAGYPIEQ